jgi:hypothetical protein
MKEHLDNILKSHVVSTDETHVKDKLLAAGFVLVHKDGKDNNEAAVSS